MIYRLLIVAMLLCCGVNTRLQAQPVAVVKDTTKRTLVNGLKHYQFTVKAGQTLFSIAKAYGVTVDDITNANPEVKTAGIKTGQSIVIPAKSGGPATPTSLPSNVKVYEIAPAAAPDTATLKLLKERCKNPEKKEVYRVAMFLPIYAKENNFDIKYTVGPEFYEGVLMGIEDYKNAGIKLQVSVFDTENDTINIKDILSKTDLKRFDLVIGPLFASAFQLVASQAKADSVVCVSPFSQVSKIITNLPNVHKITPSALTIIDQSAQFIAKKYGRQNVVFVTNNIKKDAGTMALYRQRLEAAFGKYNYTFKEFNFKGTVPEDMLNPMAQNFFVFPSSDQAQVGLFTDVLYKRSNLFSIKVWGLNQWQNYDNLSLEKLTRLNLHFARTNFADLSVKEAAAVNTRCRDKYKNDASEYFFQGYDIMQFYIAQIEKYGTAFGQCVLCQDESKGLQTDIKLGVPGAGHGLENTAIKIMQYKDNDIIVEND